MLLFDSHAHLDDSRFDEDREALIAHLQAGGVARVANAASDLETSRAAIALAEQYDFIYAMAGVHPHEAAQAPADYLEQLRTLLTHPKVVALGEIGLDYHYDLSPRDVQREKMAEQMALAVQMDKPVSFHLREAWGDAMDMLRTHKGHLPQGVMHCFSGSWETAKACLDMGFYISFAGPVTFKNAERLREVAAQVPSDRLLIETDSPYMAPEPHRGKRNQPDFVAEVASRLAAVRGVTPDRLAEDCYENASRLFGL